MLNRIQRARPFVSSGLVAIAVTVAVAGCGGSSSAPKTGDPSSTPVTSPKAPGGDATSEITKAFVDFFAGSTPAGSKINLVQDGSSFATVINAQAGSPIAESTTATVSTVRLLSSTHADVIYTVSLGGTPALKNQVGVAVKDAGTWKVGAATFCALLELEQQAPPICQRLP